jgi:hypothetical protein
MRPLFYILFSFSLLLIVGCKQKKALTPEEIEKAVRKNPNLNAGSGSYSITAPDGWDKTDTLLMGMRATVIFSPVESPGDDFRENINIVTERTGNKTTEEYLRLSRDNMKNMLTDLKEIDNGTKKINGHTANWIKYSHSYMGYALEVKVYMLIADEIAYVITCTCKKGEMENWETQFDNCVVTFSTN